MARSTTISRLSELAEDQWGLVTRRQAGQAGVPQSTLDRLATDGSILERVAHGVYHLAGAPLPAHLELRAAWLQLAPGTPAWERTLDQGVISHRSAAALYGLGHLRADTHDFTLPARRQTRRPDVRLHRRSLANDECIQLRGLPVTKPSRIASDLLADHEDPEAVASVVADAVREAFDHPATFAATLSSRAARFGVRRGDGLGLFRWLLELVGDPNTVDWIEEARRSLGEGGTRSTGRTNG
jgi:predicted transcriptional regulator of viral defense system